MPQEISVDSSFSNDDSQPASSKRAPECQQTVDLWQLLMDEMESLPELNKPCIFKIPQMLRELNPKAYTPYRVAIGPYHANDEQFKSMETYKLRALYSLMHRPLQGSSDDTLKTYIRAIERRESEARRYYSGVEDLDIENFKRMLLIDGALIVELFYSKFLGLSLRHLLNGNIKAIDEVLQDLVLLENQLPFFILEELFHCTFENTQLDYTFPEIAYWNLMHLSPFRSDEGTEVLSPFRSSENDELLREQIKQRINQKQVRHLLDLTRTFFCLDAPTPYSLDVALDHQVDQGEKENLSETSRKTPASMLKKYLVEHGKQRFIHLHMKLRSHWGRKKKHQKVEEAVANVMSSDFLNRSSATELHDAGIKFGAQKRQMEQPMHVKFDEAKGVVEMSHLKLTDIFDFFFMNVIAYEQYYLGRREKHVTQYMYFMAGLINTKEDVVILEKSHLIDSYLESHEDAATMFNAITKHTATSVDIFTYKELCDELKAYAMKPRNRWRAMLRRDYFGSPWAIISFIAAVVLLLLTALQTIATVWSTKWN